MATSRIDGRPTGPRTWALKHAAHRSSPSPASRSACSCRRPARDGHDRLRGDAGSTAGRIQPVYVMISDPLGEPHGGMPPPTAPSTATSRRTRRRITTASGTDRYVIVVASRLSPAVEDLRSTRQLSWVLDRSPAAIREAIRDGDIQGVRLPSGFRIPRAEALRSRASASRPRPAAELADRTIERLIDEVIATNERATGDLPG